MRGTPEWVLDILLIAVVVAFFALASLYVRGCERIAAPEDER